MNYDDGDYASGCDDDDDDDDGDDAGDGEKNESNSLKRFLFVCCSAPRIQI